MRTFLIVGVLLAGCGGGAKPAGTVAKPASSEPRPAGAAQETSEYCQGYSGCARERAHISWLSKQGKDSDAEPTDEDLAPEVDAEVERCESIVQGLTPKQMEWLESCTGCGGSCDVYACLDRVPEDGNEVFECYIGDPELPPPEDEDEDE